MTEKSNRVAKLMAATSVLGLALGMTAQAADTSTQIKGETSPASTAIKGTSDQHKLSAGYLKLNAGSNQLKYDSSQIKLDSNQHKLQSNQIKLDSLQHKGSSTQIKLDGTATQTKHDIPSTELNPQPEPPLPKGSGTPNPR